MANTPRHLSKAPIVEAHIAFDFASLPGELESHTAAFFAEIKTEYPNQTPIQKAQIQFDLTGSSSGSSSTVGQKGLSADGKNICTISEGSFICSRVEPYEDWNTMRTEFRRLWDIFASLGNVNVTKAAVRYINKIHVLYGTEIFDFIYTYPKLAPGLPDGMLGSFIRLQLTIPDPTGILIVTEGTLPPEKPGYAAIALDHDLQFPINENTGDLWVLLDKARELKNQYFFASISPELVKEYE